MELSGRKAMIQKILIHIDPAIIPKHFMLMVFLFFSFQGNFLTSAQDIFIEDTIAIRAVTVTAPFSLRHSPFSVIRVDSVTLSRFMSADLGTLLREKTSLSVKLYGNSGLASVSVRGLSGNHTLVTWNGISITSPNTGQYDFFLLPVLSNSTILIREGGSDLGEISGSIGGIVELGSEPSDSSMPALQLMMGAGSFNDYSVCASMNSAGKKISSNSTIWTRSAANNFRFINENNPEGPKLRRNNASFNTKGVIHDLFFKPGKYIISAHLWFNETERELPGPVTKYFGESQTDRSLRSSVGIRSETGKTKIKVNAGYVSDVNLYDNDTSDISGDNRTGTFSLKARISHRLNDKLELSMNTGDEYQEATSLSYEGKKTRNILSGSVIITATPSKRLRLTVQSRQIVSAGSFAPVELTAGASYLTSRSGKSIVRTNISRNLKLPSLNDLYWYPGGNEYLKPEVSTGGEIIYSFASVSASESKHTIEFTIHGALVNDLIQWVPGQYGYWSAENIRSVFVKGFETRINSVVPVAFGKVFAGANYTLTSSVISSSDIFNDKSVGKQTIYTPYHIFNAFLSAECNLFRACVSIVAESKRFTATDNSEWLPSNCQVNVDTGTDIKILKVNASLNLTIKNVFNSGWESIPNFPMPLRTYNINLKTIF